MGRPEGRISTLTSREQIKMVLFLILASCVVAISLIFFAQSIGRPYMGITLALGQKGWVVESVDTDGMASRAGIRVGDKPIKINGQPAEVFLEKYSKSKMVFGMSFKELVVIDGHGQPKLVNLESSSLSQQSVIQQTTLAIISFIFWMVGFFVFLKRPRNVASVLLCLFGLAVGLALSGNLATAIGVPASPMLHIFAYAIAPWLLLHFFLVLPEERVYFRSNILVYLIYLPVLITLVLFPIFGWSEGQPVLWFRTIRLLEAGVGLLAAAGVAIFNYFGAVTVRTRQQMRIVLLSSIAALVPILLLNVLPFAIFRQSVLPPGTSILFVAFIPLGMGYAVVTQKLMDIDVIVRRGIIYGTVTLVMAGILSAVVFFAVAFPSAFGTGEKVLIALAAGGLATALFGPTKNGVEALVDKLIYKDRFDYRQTIDALSTTLKLMKDTAEISRVLVGAAVNTLNLAGGCLFVKVHGSFEVGAAQGMFAGAAKREQLLSLICNRDSRLEFPNSAAAADPDVAFLLPLVTGEKEVGILCLSPKVSRQAFSSSDEYLLQGLASVGAMVMYSAMLVHDVSLRDTFISIASHELRTPLTAVIGYADLLLRRDPTAADRKQWQQTILDNGQRIAAIVDDLLDVSRIRLGRVNLNLERLQLTGVLSHQIAATRGWAERESPGKHEFVVDIAPDLLDVLADRNKFDQIVENLLSNAIKYSPNGGRITLSARNEPEQHRVVVSVADEGIGISPDDKESLFKTFHRIQRSETVTIRGVGLGLYIVKEWATAMGGDVWFDSELNKGSTFFVSVPIYNSNKTK